MSPEDLFEAEREVARLVQKSRRALERALNAAPTSDIRQDINSVLFRLESLEDRLP